MDSKTKDQIVKYPYSIRFSYNKKSYTHEFEECIYPDLERQKLNNYPKAYFGVAVLGIKDACEHYELKPQEESGTSTDCFARNVILYDGITEKEIVSYKAICLKDDWETLKDIHDKHTKTDNNN